jgi:hypothetical protein
MVQMAGRRVACRFLRERDEGLIINHHQTAITSTHFITVTLCYSR